MTMRVFLMILTITVIHAFIIQNYYTDTCFYFPLGNIPSINCFNYTIIQAWTPEQAAQLRSGALNTSDFIDVQGWVPYSDQNQNILLENYQGWRINSK